MDKIFLHGLKADTLIGVFDWERRLPQTLSLDLDIGLPPGRRSDDVADTIDYGEVCESLRRDLGGRQFFLLEALAEHIAGMVLQDFGAVWVRVRVVKPGILPDVREVGVEIERGSQSAG
ncbi:MAG: dihydroneopterin aldolase [Neisseria sp.]|nr:dihydroneopterin aldolase [Neisseria sp.]